MKKRFKEGKTVSHPAVSVSSLIILFFLAGNLFSQVPINGFCQLQQIKIPQGFYGFRTVDVDRDNETETILIDPTQKRFGLIDKTDKGISVATKFFFFPISDFRFFNSVDKLGDFYLFVSEKERKIGLTSFAANGSLILLNQKTLDSYPSKFIVGDINQDSENEAVVYGSNFNGLSVVFQNKFKISNEKIIKNKLFSDAVFVDLDYDGYPDIAAIDLIGNSIVLFMNNNGNLKPVRSISFPENIKNLSASDYDGDEFTDLGLTTENTVEILYGDSVSSFSRKKIIDTGMSIAGFLLSDFNGDEKPDLVYTDEVNHDCYIKFSTEEGYAEPVLLSGGVKFSSLDIDNQTGSRLTLISPEGKLYSYSKFGLSDSVEIKIGGKPEKLYTVEINKRGKPEPDFYFIDSYDNTLKMLTGKGNELCKELIVYDLVETHNNAVFSRDFESGYKFYCYSDAGRFVEIVEQGHLTKEVKREAVYTSFPIEKVLAQNDTSFVVVERKGDSLFVENFNKTNEQLIDSRLELVDSNYYGSMISREGSKSVYYFTKTDSVLTFKKYNISDNGSYAVDMSKYAVPADSVFIHVSAVLNDKKNESFHIFHYGKNINYVLVQGEKIIDLIPQNEDVFLHLINNEDVKIYENYKNKAYIYLYDRESKFIYAAEVLKRKRKIKFTKIAEMKNAGNYFIKKLYGMKYLINTDTTDNSIIFRKVND